MKNPWLLPAAALAIGAVGGFISGKNTGTPDQPTSAAEAALQRSRASDRTGGSDEESKRAGRAKNVADAMNTPGHSARLKRLVDFYAGLTPAQLEEEAKKLESLPMSERIMASFLLFGRWAEVDPTAAMANANSMGMAGMFVRPTILQSWASVDPENAAKYFADNPREFAMMGGMGGPGGGQSGAAVIASEWAKQDPQSALAWASALNGRDKTQAMTSVIREVAMTDPKKAAELAATMDPAERGDAYASIAQRWGAGNFAEGESWVRSLPADQQAAAMSSLISGLSQDNPQLALSKIEAMTEGDEKNRAMRTTLENLAKLDPAAAIAALSKQDAQLQEQTIDDIIPTWAAKDNAAVVTYINGLAAGDVRDSAVASYVMNDRQSEPASLMSMAETIQDERDRDRTLGIASMKWMREDPDAAKNYIQNSASIPDNMKERLMSGRGGWGGPPGRRR